MTETRRLSGDADLPQTSSVTASKNAGRNDDREDPSGQRPKRARRAFLTQNACRRCRQKKSKCDGRRPTCTRCEKYTTECTYDVAQEGLTRMQNLQQQLDNKTIDHERLQEILRAMEEGTDQEATALLARLRLSLGVDDLHLFAQSLQASSASSTSDMPAMAQSLLLPDGSLPAQLQNLYQLASHSAHPSEWDTSMAPDWNTWSQDTGEPSTPQSASSFRDESQLAMEQTASQRFQPFADGQGQYSQQLGIIGGTAQQPNMLNWQGGLPPQQYPTMPQLQYGGPSSQVPNLGQTQEYQGGQFHGGLAQFQSTQPGSGRSQQDEGPGPGPGSFPGISHDGPT